MEYLTTRLSLSDSVTTSTATELQLPLLLLAVPRGVVWVS